MTLIIDKEGRRVVLEHIVNYIEFQAAKGGLYCKTYLSNGEYVTLAISGFQLDEAFSRYGHNIYRG